MEKRIERLEQHINKMGAILNGQRAMTEQCFGTLDALMYWIKEDHPDWYEDITTRSAEYSRFLDTIKKLNQEPLHRAAEIWINYKEPTKSLRITADMWDLESRILRPEPDAQGVMDHDMSLQDAIDFVKALKKKGPDKLGLSAILEHLLVHQENANKAEEMIRLGPANLAVKIGQYDYIELHADHCRARSVDPTDNHVCCWCFVLKEDRGKIGIIKDRANELQDCWMHVSFKGGETHWIKILKIYPGENDATEFWVEAAVPNYGHELLLNGSKVTHIDQIQKLKINTNDNTTEIIWYSQSPKTALVLSEETVTLTYGVEDHLLTAKVVSYGKEETEEDGHCFRLKIRGIVDENALERKTGYRIPSEIVGDLDEKKNTALVLELRRPKESIRRIYRCNDNVMLYELTGALAEQQHGNWLLNLEMQNHVDQIHINNALGMGQNFTIKQGVGGAVLAKGHAVCVSDKWFTDTQNLSLILEQKPDLPESVLPKSKTIPMWQIWDNSPWLAILKGACLPNGEIKFPVQPMNSLEELAQSNKDLCVRLKLEYPERMAEWLGSIIKSIPEAAEDLVLCIKHKGYQWSSPISSVKFYSSFEDTTYLYAQCSPKKKETAVCFATVSSKQEGRSVNFRIQPLSEETMNHMANSTTKIGPITVVLLEKDDLDWIEKDIQSIPTCRTDLVLSIEKMDQSVEIPVDRKNIEVYLHPDTNPQIAFHLYKQD